MSMKNILIGDQVFSQRMWTYAMECFLQREREGRSLQGTRIGQKVNQLGFCRIIANTLVLFSVFSYLMQQSSAGLSKTYIRFGQYVLVQTNSFYKGTHLTRSSLLQKYERKGVSDKFSFYDTNLQIMKCSDLIAQFCCAVCSVEKVKFQNIDLYCEQRNINK